MPPRYRGVADNGSDAPARRQVWQRLPDEREGCRVIRWLGLTIAFAAGFYAAGAWMCGELTLAGVAGAISAACVIVAEGIRYCERRRDERARRTRAEVWERRDAGLAWITGDAGGRYTLSRGGVFRREWDARPVVTTMTYDKHGEPISGYDSHGHSAVWPFEAGGFE